MSSSSPSFDIAENWGLDAREEGDAFTFPPKPLPEGRVVRPMREGDIDSVVDLAFEEFYEGPAEVEDTASLEGWRVWEETWRRATLIGHFEEADVEKLTDW